MAFIMPLKNLKLYVEYVIKLIRKLTFTYMYFVLIDIQEVINYIPLNMVDSTNLLIIS